MSEQCFAARAQPLAGMAGVLFGWTPDGFWNATPAELAALAAAIAPDAGVPPADRDTLQRLMEAFPDG